MAKTSHRLRSGGVRPPHERDAHATSSYALARLRRELKPFKLHWYATVGSTNSKAAQLRRDGKLFAPACVLTGRQTAGRGRGANVWHAPRGVITVTFAVPTSDALPPHQVPLVAGLAVRDACAELGATDVGLKWPNDLWHDDLKLAGLLCERVDNVDLIGIGLNVDPDLREMPAGVRAKVTSLAAITRSAPDQTTVLTGIARHLRALLLHTDHAAHSLLQRIGRHMVLTGRPVRVTDGLEVIEGTCDGIDRVGRLLVSTRDGRRSITAGTVTLIER